MDEPRHRDRPVWPATIVAAIITAIATLGAAWYTARTHPEIIVRLFPGSTATQPPNEATEAAESTNVPPSSGRNQACETDQAGFPQNEDAARATYHLPDSSRVTMEAYDGCSTGFILRGLDPVRLEVPRGGCIDVDPKADIDGNSRLNPGDPDGVRVTSGSVRTGNLTFWYSCTD